MCELRDCSEFLVRGRVVLLLGGVPVSNKVSEGAVRVGVSIFYTHKKRNRTKQNITFAQFPAALESALLP